MKIDTHVHLLVSKTQLHADFTSINAMLDIAKISGITALCVTEHIEAIGYDQLMRDLFVNNKLNGVKGNGYIQTKQGIKLYPGAELQLLNGTNIGVHADLESLLNLNHEAGSYTLEALDDVLKSYGGWYKLVAHHIFWPNKTYPDHNELAKYVSAIEMPAKDLGNADKYIELADRYDLPTIGGSDAHTFIQIGACYSECDDIYQVEIHPLIQLLKKTNRYHSFTDFSKRLVEMSKIYRSISPA